MVSTRGWPRTKPHLLILGSYNVAKAAVVTDICLKVACLSSVLLHNTSNIVGMSWPVRYGEVATLAQEFLEGLSPPTSEMLVFKPPFLTGSNGCFDQ